MSSLIRLSHYFFHLIQFHTNPYFINIFLVIRDLSGDVEQEKIIEKIVKVIQGIPFISFGSIH